MEHLIAKGVDKAIQYLHRRRIEAWKGDGAPFVTDDNARRFSALASMIAGRDVEVVDIRGDTPPKRYWPVLYKMAHPALLPEHGFAWSDSEKIFFPVSIADLADEVAREDAALLLLFFLTFQIRCGTLDFAMRKKAALASDQMLSDIFWIIENARLYREIQKEYSGAARCWPALAAYYLEKRPPGKYLNEPEQKVEGLLKETIEAAFTTSPKGVVAELSQGPIDSFNRAAELKGGWAAEGLKTRKYRAIVPFFPWGKLIPERIRDIGSGLMQFDERKKTSSKTADHVKDEKPNKPPKKSERFAAKKEAVDELANENGLTLNIYDKILSWADFTNVTRPFDDDPDDDPKAKADECEELTVSELEKTTVNTFNAEIEKADAYTGEETTDDLTEVASYYPEWDYKRRIFRPDYARVVETLVDGADAGAGFYEKVLNEKRGTIKEVTRNLEMLSPARRLIGRQFDGTSIDLNAAVDAIADLSAGRTPDERLYCIDQKTERDLSALFLLDLSMSTDGWSGEKKIIDHEKEALIILCEALKKLRDQYAIYGFSGKGRKHCRFLRIKGFADNYAEAVRNRIGGLIPYSYTRMGPAIRHATKILSGAQSRSRLLFILSDGKPNDIDVYEGRYGVEDTRMAIKEAQTAGITPFCLTIDTGAADYLPSLFGRGNYAVVSNAGMIAKKLPELYARIIHKL